MKHKKLMVCVCIILLACMSMFLCSCSNDTNTSSKSGVANMDSFTCKFCGAVFPVSPSDLYDIAYDGLLYRRLTKAFDCPECGCTYAYTETVGWTYANVEYEIVK